MQYDIFLHAPGLGEHGSDWKLYVDRVAPTNFPPIATTLEKQGERVRVMESRNAGRMVYCTIPRTP
jgi:hypothetical protein